MTDEDRTEDIVVLEIPNQPPIASFAYSPANPKAGEWVTFNASSSNDPDGEITFYEWDWDNDEDFDEYTKSSKTTFWWNEAGTYNVKLRVIDDDGAVSSPYQLDITVEPKKGTLMSFLLVGSIGCICGGGKIIKIS